MIKYGSVNTSIISKLSVDRLHFGVIKSYFVLSFLPHDVTRLTTRQAERTSLALLTIARSTLISIVQIMQNVVKKSDVLIQ